jgi:hypothetical protein
MATPRQGCVTTSKQDNKKTTQERKKTTKHTRQAKRHNQTRPQDKINTKT